MATKFALHYQSFYSGFELLNETELEIQNKINFLPENDAGKHILINVFIQSLSSKE